LPEHSFNAPSTASTTDTMPTGFFDLPRELRDEIYDHLWVSMPRVLIPYSPKLRLKANFNFAPGSSNPFTSLPQGISASKSLLHEALSVFHCKATVQVERYPGTPEPTYGGHESAKPRSSEAAFAEFKFSTPALTPLVIRQLCVNAEMNRNDFFNTVGSYGIETAVNPQDATVLRHLVDNYARIGAPKSWKIHLNLRPLLHGQQKIDLIAFYYLERISKNLASIAIVFEMVWSMKVPNTLMDLSLGPHLCTEMETLGQNVFPNFKATAETVYMGDRKIEWRFNFTKM
jgi:hypothetical protein